jgi:hypothetical protein
MTGSICESMAFWQRFESLSAADNRLGISPRVTAGQEHGRTVPLAEVASQFDHLRRPGLHASDLSAIPRKAARAVLDASLAERDRLVATAMN